MRTDPQFSFIRSLRSAIKTGTLVDEDFIFSNEIERRGVKILFLFAAVRAFKAWRRFSPRSEHCTTRPRWNFPFPETISSPKTLNQNIFSAVLRSLQVWFWSNCSSPKPKSLMIGPPKRNLPGGGFGGRGGMIFGLVSRSGSG
jgi:hypothetical protein